MYIDERIFNELVPINMGSPDENGLSLEEFDSIYWELAQKEADISDLDEEDEDYGTLVQDRITDADIISVWRIKNDNLLMKALIEYFGGYQEALSKIRSAVAYSDEIYFVTGGGYDIIDKDLLGGDGSGKTKEDFLKKINQNETLTAVQQTVNQSLKILNERDIEIALEFTRSNLNVEDVDIFERGYEEGFRHAMSKIKTLLNQE